jgi:hypothetical protein
MDLGPSDLVNLSPLRATLAAIVGRLRLPARHVAPLEFGDRIEPRLDADRPGDPPEAQSRNRQPLPYIAAEESPHGTVVPAATSGPHRPFR